MCGIAGVIGFKSNKQIITRMLSKMARRGPDFSGIYENRGNNYVLGHTRLSIIDLSTKGNQPMHILDNKFSIVFNGEIYNYKSIKVDLESEGVIFKTDSDTEVILWGWYKWGKDIVGKLRGMFAFCIYDNDNNTCFLVRDRLGIKPLLYYRETDNIVFASSLSAILASGMVESRLSKEGFLDYITLGAVSQPNTMIKGVLSLEPGTIVTIEENKFKKTESYWDFKLLSNRELINGNENYNQVVDKTRILLEEATELHMVGDVPVGSFLSGGVDSTVITALMAKNVPNKIKTFTIGFESEKYLENELSEAKVAANFIGTDHTEVILGSNDVFDSFDDFISSIDQPSIDGLNTYFVSKATKENGIKVALSGLGADELFAGYDSFLQLNKTQDVKASVRNKLIGQLYPYLSNRITLNNSFKGASIDKKFTYFRNLIKYNDIRKLINYKDINTYSKDYLLVLIKKLDLSFNDLVLRYSEYELRSYLLNILLRDSDALSMAHSIELRPIFLDHKIVEYSFLISGNLKLNKGITKSILKDATKDLLPKDFFNRKKAGFSLPMFSWLNGVLKPRVIYTLNSEYSELFFKKKYLLFLIEKIEKREYTSQVWAIFVFLSWAEKNKIS